MMDTPLERHLLNLSVLYVEDEEFTRKYVAAFLEKHVTNVVLAENGAQGLELFKNNKIDVVITDITMPVMSGLQMSQHIKAMNPGIHIAITTAHHEEEGFLEAIELSVDKFLLKPLNLKKLEEYLSNVDSRIYLRKELERQRKFLSEYKKAVDASAIVSIVDPKGIITYVNDEFCKISGYTAQEAMGEMHDLVRHPDTPPSILSDVWKTILDKKIWKGVIENRRKNGQSYFTDTTIVPILDPHDNIVEFLAVRHDITNLKAMGEENIQAIFDNDEALIIVTDEKFEVKIINKSMKKALGVEKISKEMKLCERFDNPENKLECLDEAKNKTQPERLNLFKKHLESGTGQHKVTMTTDSGEHRVYAASAHTVQDRLLGTKYYNIYTLVDITELEIMRQDQLNNIKLASIGKLAAGITHEINTPLTYIKGNLEMLMGDIERASECDMDTKNEFLEMCTAIDDGVKRISNIVDSMREIASAKKDEKIRCNIYPTLVYATRMVFNRAKQITNIFICDEPFAIDLDKDAKEFFTYAQSQRLEQVWIVLLNNALDEFSTSKLPFEQKYIKISVENVDNGLKILFRDNAGGIPPHLLDGIFDMFTSTKAQKGMGVGLNVARSIVEVNGGTIKAYNDEAGAVFEIFLTGSE